MAFATRVEYNLRWSNRKPTNVVGILPHVSIKLVLEQMALVLSCEDWRKYRFHLKPASEAEPSWSWRGPS